MMFPNLNKIFPIGTAPDILILIILFTESDTKQFTGIAEELSSQRDPDVKLDNPISIGKSIKMNDEDERG